MLSINSQWILCPLCGNKTRNKIREEAVLKVVSDTDCLVCFSCPCSCDVGDVLGELVDMYTNYQVPRYA